MVSGSVIGFAVGVPVGLLVACMVVVWVGSLPAPKYRNDAIDGDLQEYLERKRNAGWDPNAPLRGRSPAPAAPALIQASAAASLPVRVDAIDVDLGTARDNGGFEFFVQAADFPELHVADDLRAELARAGVHANVSAQGGGPGKRFRVRLGPFPSKQQALSIMDALESKGLDPSLVQVPR